MATMVTATGPRGARQGRIVIQPLSAQDTGHLQRAFAAIGQGRLHDAAGALQQLSPPARRHPDAQYVMALALRAEGRLAEARPLVEQALAAAPAHAGLWNGYADLLQAMGDRAAAFSAFQRAAQLAPGSFDAWLNLGLAGLDAERWPEAGDALAQALKLKPGEPRALAVRGLVEQGRGNLPAAVAAYRAALMVNARDARTRHNLATALRSLGDYTAALKELDRAIADGLSAPETATIRAHVLAELGQYPAALAQYRAVIAASPGHVDAQETLALLLPQIGEPAAALDGFRAALSGAAPPALWSAAIRVAQGTGDAAQMLAWAESAARAHGDSPEWALPRVHALAMSGDRDAALRAATAAVAQWPGVAPAHSHLAHLCLQSGDPAAAAAHALTASRLAPFDQTPWALLSLAWRLTDDPRERWLIDYDRLVMIVDIAPPPGFDDLAGFLAALTDSLTRLHTTQHAPAEQSLRHGTQTRGRLFDRPDPVIQGLKASLTAAINAALATLPVDAAHPFLGRRGTGIRFSGSWSVRLQSQGFHISHMHPEGWLSSAFYVALPPEVLAGASDAGRLLFGVPDATLGLDLSPRRVVAPAPGRLVLFPSYAWHGTAPFESRTPRLTAAFDALPT